MRHPFVAFGVVLLLAATGVPPAVEAQSASERRLKAAIVSKFPEFVEWPAAISGRPRIDLCVASPSPFGSDLDDLVAGVSLNGKPLGVRRIERDADVDSCHVLFISARARAARPGLLPRAASLPILTVSDDDTFLDDGGIVRLRTVDGRVRFDVNATQAERVGLRISSQLLQLALTVRGGPP